MALRTLDRQFGRGGAGLQDIRATLAELQGFTVSVIPTGAAANTKMNIAGMRSGDTLSAVLATIKATGVASDDTANCTIQSTKATGVLTPNVVVAGNSFVLNGVTYTARAVPTLANEWAVAGVDATDATRIVAAINAYESRYRGAGDGDGFNLPRVVATKVNSTVVVTALDDGVGNNPVVVNTTGGTMAVVSTVFNAITATCVSVIATDAITVNGVLFTVTATPALITDIPLAASDALQGPALANAVNRYESFHGGLDVTATAVLGVVTFSARNARKGNNITLTGTAVRLAASGTASGALSGGTATGGIKSTTDLSASSVVVYWYRKN